MPADSPGTGVGALVGAGAAAGAAGAVVAAAGAAAAGALVGAAPPGAAGAAGPHAASRDALLTVSAPMTLSRRNPRRLSRLGLFPIRVESMHPPSPQPRLR